jgi:hypothetical protein
MWLATGLKNLIDTTLNLIKVVSILSERLPCCLVAGVALSEVVDMSSPCRIVWLWLTRRHGGIGLCPLGRIEPSTLRRRPGTVRSGPDRFGTYGSWDFRLLDPCDPENLYCLCRHPINTRLHSISPDSSIFGNTCYTSIFGTTRYTSPFGILLITHTIK